MKKYLILIFAAAFTVASCAKNEAPSEQNTVCDRFLCTVGQMEGTRTTIEYDDDEQYLCEVCWEVGDSILVKSGEDYKVFKATSVNGNSAVFSAEGASTFFTSAHDAAGYEAWNYTAKGCTGIPSKIETFICAEELDSTITHLPMHAQLEANAISKVLEFNNTSAILKIMIPAYYESMDEFTVTYGDNTSTFNSPECQLDKIIFVPVTPSTDQEFNFKAYSGENELNSWSNTKTVSANDIYPIVLSYPILSGADSTKIETAGTYTIDNSDNDYFVRIYNNTSENITIQAYSYEAEGGAIKAPKNIYVDVRGCTVPKVYINYYSANTTVIVSNYLGTADLQLTDLTPTSN